jgi:hypothetical protein
LVAAVALASTAGVAGIDTSSHAANQSACRPSPTVPGVTEGESLAGTVAPSRGVLRAELLLVQASDAPLDPSVEPPHELIDEAAEWFRTVSYGRLAYDVETPARWFALPAVSSAYAADPERYLRDAIAAADPHVDFSKVDVVYLSPASSTPVATPTAAILNGFGVHADGKEIRFWVPWQPGFALSGGPPVTLLHETSHLLGLPDLYVAGVGRSFHRWHRWKLGWLDESQIVCVTGRSRRVVTLTPVERVGGTKAVLIRHGSRVLVAEARARIGYDRTLCATGVLVYEVDMTPFQRAPIQIFEAGADHGLSARCGAKANAPLRLGRGNTHVLRVSGVRIEFVAKLLDGSYRIHVTS